MRYTFLIIYILSTFFSFSQEETRLALVIGNSNYDKGELKNPVNDANLIAQTLDSLNFDVILKENIATQGNFKRAILEFGKKRPNYDVAFVYYAGHGIQVDGENFLLPTKEEFNNEDEVELFGVSVQDIMRYLEAKSNEVNILILDACRNNPFESNFETTRSLDRGSGLAKIPPPTGSLIAFSTDSGKTAPDGEGDNSIYTISLAKNMLLEDTSIDQVFRNVRAEVLNETEGEQRPVEATQLTGKTFILRPGTFEKEYIIVREIIDGEGDYANNYLKGLEYVTLMLNKNPLDKEATKLGGELYIKLGEYDKALEYVNRGIELDPNYGLNNRYTTKGYLLHKYFDKTEEALEFYNKSIELDPERASSYYWRGLYFEDLENFEMALVDYKKAVELDPDDSGNYFKIAYVAHKLDDFNLALNTYFQYLENFENDATVHNNVALIYENDLENYEKAIEYYDLAIKDEYGLSYRNKAMMLYYDLDKKEEALELLSQAVELEPENDFNYYLMAECYYDERNWAMALINYKKALELNPDDEDYYFDTAYSYSMLNEFELALSTYLQFLEKFGPDSGVYNNSALIYEENLKNYEKAIEYYDLAIERGSISSHRNKADLIYYQFDKKEEALELYNKAIELDPENAYSYSYRAKEYYYAEGNWEMALADYKKALELDPNDDDYYFGVAYAYGQLDQYDLELSTYLQYIEKFGPDSGVYNNIALIYEENLKNYEKAIEYYDLAIERGSISSHRNKADLIYYQFDKKEEALELYNKAIKLDPENAYNYYLMAEYYSIEGNWEMALADYKKALELDPNDDDYYFGVAYAYGQLDQYDLELSTYLQYIEKFGSGGASASAAYNNIALIYENDLENYKKAIEYYDFAIELGSMHGYRNKATLLYENFDKTEEALELYNKAIKLDPENYYNYEFRAQFFLDEENWEMALADYKKALELDPERSFYKSRIAYSYLEVEDYDMALNTYLQYLEKFGESSWIYDRIGQVYEEGFKNYEKAIAYYDLSILYEDNSYAHQRKGVIYQNSNLYEDALSEFSRFLEFYPDNTNSYFYLMNLYISYDKFEEGIEVSEKLIDLAPEDPDIYYKLSLIYEKQKDYVKAIHASNISIARFGLGDYYVSTIDNLDNKLVKEDMYKHRISLYKIKGMNDFVCEDLNLLRELIIKESKDEDDKNSKLIDLEKFAGMTISEIENCRN